MDKYGPIFVDADKVSDQLLRFDGLHASKDCRFRNFKHTLSVSVFYSREGSVESEREQFLVGTRVGREREGIRAVYADKGLPMLAG